MTGAVRPRPRAATSVDAAFDALFVRERTAMVRVAYLLVGSEPLAEEIVQEAFASVYARWDRIDNHGGFLRQCVVNGARSALRRRSLERRKAQLLVDDGTAPAGRELLDALAALPLGWRSVVGEQYGVLGALVGLVPGDGAGSEEGVGLLGGQAEPAGRRRDHRGRDARRLGGGRRRGHDLLGRVATGADEGGEAGQEDDHGRGAEHERPGACVAVAPPLDDGGHAGTRHPGTVKSSLHRGLAKLREALEP